eukprot:TRINITY_DN913_c0_g1_i1.p1 TRINITY_DN913_c0_g1~~TRINITY_DN913_c0_g1_i1.p1  ORF type:complete len:345 (-),score=81.03 TRINITY_DN913_c0_g1_i1:82-1056(-)
MTDPYFLNRISHETSSLWPQSASSYLRNTKISTVFPPTKHGIVSVEKKDSVTDGFKKLIENQILSVPLYDERHHQYTAFLDMLDFVHAIVGTGIGLGSGSVGDLMSGSEQLKKQNCGQVADVSMRNPWYPVGSEASLGMALRLMVDHGVHRIPILSPDGLLASVVTQSQLVRELYNRLSLFDIGDKTIEQLQIGIKEVLTIHQDQKAIEAFDLIFKNKVTGVAVVDDAGRLIGNISATDMRNIGADINYVSRVFHPTIDYLKLGPNGAEIKKPYCVQLSATLGETMEILVNTKTHRIYIVDKNDTPIGVISLGDVLGLFVERSK